MVKAHKHECPVARTLNIFGDRWTLLIIREAFYGATRFSDFERHSGIAKNLLSQRLKLLCAEDVFKKVNVGTRGERYAYYLTPKGRALQSVLIAMTQWGNEYCFQKGAEPISIVEDATGIPIAPLQFTSACGRVLSPRELSVSPGPGASGETRRHIERAAHRVQVKKAINRTTTEVVSNVPNH